MKKVYTIVMTFLFLLNVHAQVASFTTAQSDIIPRLLFGNSKTLIYSGISPTYLSNIFEGDKSILYLDDYTAIVNVVAKDNSFNGISKINNKGKVLWTSKVANISGIAKLGNKILVISSNYFGFNCWNQITATLIDTATGTELGKKLVYENKTNFLREFKILADSSGIFHGILIMHSKYECNGKKKYKIDDFFIAKDIMDGAEILYPDENFSWTSIPLEQSTFSGNGASFAAATTNTKGEIFIAGLSVGKLFVEKYLPHSTTPVKKLETNFEASTDKFFNGLIKSLDDNTIGVTIKTEIGKRDKWLKEAVFNFDTQQANASATLLDKAFSKSLDITNAEDLEAAGFFKYKDKYIVVKQTEYKYSISGETPGANKTITYTENRNAAGDIVVSIYDKNMILQKNIALNKIYVAEMNMGIAPGIKIIGNSLYIIYNSVPRLITAFSSRHYNTARLNLDKPESFQEIELETGLDKGDMMEPSETIWFGKTALVPCFRVDKKKSYRDLRVGTDNFEFTSLYQAVNF